jgi:hypothetical protein
MWGNEVKYGRTQWSFFTSELPETTVKFNINFTTAAANNTCVPQTLAELEQSKGGSRTEADFRKSTGWTEEGVPIRDNSQSNSNFLREQGFRNSSLKSASIENTSLMQDASNNRYNCSITQRWHNETYDNSKKIDYYQSGKIVIQGRGQTYLFKNLNERLNPYYFLIR